MKIKRILAATLCDRPERASVNKLVDECYRLALAYLQKKARSGYLLPHLFGLTLEDLALDCFADLFQRDERGRFNLLDQYFASVKWQKMGEQDLYIVLRRLIFSKVNEGLFRRYREADPTLAKIIRNIKDAVKADTRLQLERYNGSAWLIAGDFDASELSGAPIAPVEVLEAHLIAWLCRSASSHELVSSFVEFAAEHPYYCSAYPVTGFAQAIRAAYVHVGETSEEAAAAHEQVLRPEEVEQAIEQATQKVQTVMHDSYVKKGKVCVSTFDTYFHTVRDILTAQFVRDSPPVGSYFDALKTYIPSLSRGSYSQEHRNILEYITKLSRSQLLVYLKNQA
ncbi:MAG: hypothetical protein R2834_10245 [Rhodothermales bacterium]